VRDLFDQLARPGATLATGQGVGAVANQPPVRLEGAQALTTRAQVAQQDLDRL